MSLFNPIRLRAGAPAQTPEALRADLEHLHRLVKDLRIDLALRRLRRKYSRDQPRAPAGNPDGGQWTSGHSSAQRDKNGRGLSDEISAARRGGGIPRALWNLTVRQFVSRYCAGQVNRVLPRQFENVTIADLLDLRKGGDAAADKCYKLLNEPRFRKN